MGGIALRKTRNKNNGISEHRKQSKSFRWVAKNKAPQKREKKKEKVTREEKVERINLENATVEELKKIFHGLHFREILNRLRSDSGNPKCN